MADGSTSRSGTIDAVLPLVARDFERFERLLLPSLLHYFEALGTCWVVVPGKEFKKLQKQIRDPRFRVVPEDAVLPELEKAKVRHTKNDRPLSGWMVQQLLKLSMARHVSTPFYLTLDADVVCVKPVHYETLIRDNRAIARVSEQDPQARPASINAAWYRMSAEFLGLPGAKRTHGVTPIMLSSEAVLRLFGFLEARSSGKRKRAEHQLLKDLAWTEYTLYYTYLEHFALLETYHLPVPHDISGNGIWQRWNPDLWNPAQSFGSQDQFWFSVLQSNNPNLELNSIVHRIQTYFHELGEPSPF
jgi:hypothetical protein